jgi:hypothetical protein
VHKKLKIQFFLIGVGQTLQDSGTSRQPLCQSHIRSPDLRVLHNVQKCSIASKGLVLLADIPSAILSAIVRIEGEFSSCFTIFSPRFDFR